MKWKASSQLHRITSIRQEQESQVIRDVHYSEDGVEDISLKRKKQVAPTGDNTRGYVEKETKKNRSEIKGQKCTPRKWPEYVTVSTKKRWVQGGHRDRLTSSGR
ncbi:MAG: hypothetical protein LBE64_18155 [Acinetobacter pittii]|jgi:hypothetical protein|nr:hypothetical protein [Acinetobacter pittii]